MRHAEATSEARDVTKPLSEHGQWQASKIADFLVANHILISQVYHSEKLRTRQSAEAIVKKITPTPNLASLLGLLPDAPVKPIASYCNDWHEDTLIVGHLPFMANLSSELLFGKENNHLVDFNTAAILCLERYAPAKWSIAWFIHPDLLASDTLSCD
jgi:phosphohistidine phosphatase